MNKIQQILCPTDFSQASLLAPPYAVEIARLFNAEIFLIHVVPLLPPAAGDLSFYTAPAVMEYQAAIRVDADKQIEQTLCEQIPEEVKASKVLRDGDAASEILQAVKDLQINLRGLSISLS